MELNGYRAEEDKTFVLGEQYFVYKGGDLVGWIRMNNGLLRVAAVYPPEDILYCEPFGETSEDYFLSAKDYRKAMRISIHALSDFYNDSREVEKKVLAIMGPVTPVAEQLDLFAS